jgi:hypothetical protein
MCGDFCAIKILDDAFEERAKKQEID